MRVICHNAHSKTPVEFLYLETAAQPSKNVISSRRIMYLHNILSRNSDELVKRVFDAQKNNPTQGDFICLVKSDLEYIEEPYNEQNITSMSKSQFKTHIKKKLNQAVFNSLKVLQNTHSKVRDIKYSEFKIQPYLKCHTFSNSIASVLFNMRSSMTKNIKSNFSSLHRDNLYCKMKCQEPGIEDNQSHILQCQVLQKYLNSEQAAQTKNVKYNDLFESLEKQREVALVMSRLLQIREDILEKESLPMGSHRT